MQSTFVMAMNTKKRLQPDDIGLLLLMMIMWLKLWMKIVETKDVLRIKRFLLKNHLQPKRY